MSVNVARPRIIALMNDEPVRSGIGKRPVSRDSIFVGKTNLEDDGQADLSVHGGADKAVYAYSASNWPWWETRQQLACSPAAFGENLTLESGDETEISIGDRFVWGDAELEVAQPRAPCFKFAIHTQRPDAPALMTASGRCGFYLRVTSEGFAPIENAALERSFASGNATVREAFFAVLGKPPEESLRHVLAARGLAQNWRSAVEKRLATRQG